MIKYITPELILSWHPCDAYDEAKIRRLFGRCKWATVEEILRAPIPPCDALWVVLRKGCTPVKTLRLFACECAERMLKRKRKAGRESDERGWTAVHMSRRTAIGKVGEPSAAWSARSAEAVAWSAARSAETARSTAWFAEATRSAAEAAWSAESNWQRAALLRLLRRVS